MATEKICCVYKMEIGNEFYIGATNNLHLRKKSHEASLIGNKHPNKKIQSLYNNLEDKCLHFSIIELCAIETLSKREEFFISTLNPTLNKIRHLPIKKDRESNPNYSFISEPKEYSPKTTTSISLQLEVELNTQIEKILSYEKEKFGIKKNKHKKINYLIALALKSEIVKIK